MRYTPRFITRAGRQIIPEGDGARVYDDGYDSLAVSRQKAAEMIRDARRAYREGWTDEKPVCRRGWEWRPAEDAAKSEG